MALKSNSIRIGDLLQDKNSKEVFKVEKAFYTLLELNLKNSEPIPLSVEWLKKANYKQLRRVEKTYSLGNFEDNSSIYFTGVRFIHIHTGTHLEYLHELQNLHLCLQKQELKFKNDD